MHQKTLAQLVKALRTKAISSFELTQYFLTRIKKHNPKLNSFITITEEHALNQAKQADRQLAKGDAPLLTGVPMVQKDIFCTQGIRTTCASKMLDNFISPYNATIVEKLNNANVVMLGKTNMDEFAMGSSNENSYYGPVKNPWHLDSIPGGSSGGTAAAVAARLAPAGTGTDTGGSIRQPAALCGVTGLKPTYGRVSRYGMIAFASSLDHGGLLSQNAEDIALLLNIIAGHDSKDSTSAKRQVPDYTASLTSRLEGLTIGLPQEHLRENLDPSVESAMTECIKHYESLGVRFIDISLRHTQYAASAYYVIAPAECSSNLARYDGIRYGYRCQNPKDLEDLYHRTRREGFGKEVKRRIMIGTYALSSGYYEAYYQKAQKVRSQIRQDFTDAFKTVDMILTPTTPHPAFKIGEKKDPVSMYLSDIFTIPASLAGLPAVSMPVGFNQKNTLPIGLQLIANAFQESRLLNAVHQYQTLTDWHQKVPTGFQ